MSYAYNELFWGKASIYALIENGQRWEDKGTGGQLRLYRNKTLTNDVQIGWFKDTQQLWWRLAPGKHSKLRSKGPRAWVVKANSTNSGEQETLAIRFSTEEDSAAFELQYNLIFAPQQTQQELLRQQQEEAQRKKMEQEMRQMEERLRIQRQTIANMQNQFNNPVNNYPPPTNQYNNNNNTNVSNSYQQNQYPYYNNNNNNNGMIMSGSMPSNFNQFTNASSGMNASSIPQYNNGFMNNNNNNNNPMNINTNINQQNNTSYEQQLRAYQQQRDELQLAQQRCREQQEQQKKREEAERQRSIQLQKQREEAERRQRQMTSNGNGGGGYQPPPIVADPTYQQPAKSATTWECGVCTYNNMGERSKCGLCGMQRQLRKGSGGSSTNEQIPIPPTPKTTHNSQTNLLNQQSNNSNNNTQFPFTDTASSLDRQQSVLKVGQWRCPVCTLVNDEHSKSCEACNKPKPIGKRALLDNLSPSTQKLHNIRFYVDEDDDDDNNDSTVNINGNSQNKSSAQRMLDDFKIQDQSGAFGNGLQGGTVAPRDKYGNIISNATDFENACSDIVACNANPSPVFNTLKSVSRKLTKDDVRYRTLDLQNPRVVERLIGYEGVLDFLTLLGFAPDENGIKLVCEQKPNIQVVKNAVEVLQSYEYRLGFGKKGKKSNNNDNNNGAFSDNGRNNNFNTPGHGGGAGHGDDLQGGIDASTVQQEEEDNEMSIDQIIAWGTHEHARDTESMSTLIMTHVLYSDSLSLLRALRKRYFVAIPGDIRDSGNKDKIAEFQEKVQKKIQLKVLKALKDWMKTYWESDFGNNEELRKEVLSFVDQMEKKQDECPWNTKFAQMIKNDFTKYCNRGGPRRSSTKKLDNVTLPKGYDITNMKKIKAEEFADQITLMDFTLFEKIEARECLGQAWKKKDSKKRAPNVLAMIKQFNNITTMIQMHILNEGNLNKRGKRLSYIIKMGERFRETHNFSALCALFSALNSAPIHRLKTLWKKLSEKENKYFEIWRNIFDSGGNHRNLRANLRSTTGACIPHIGIFLQDLVFIEDGNDTQKKIKIEENKQAANLVNFGKQLKLVDRIQYIQRYQQNKYDSSIIKNENEVFQKALIDEFEKYKDYTEDEIWEISTAVKKSDK